MFMIGDVVDGNIEWVHTHNHLVGFRVVKTNIVYDCKIMKGTNNQTTTLNIPKVGDKVNGWIMNIDENSNLIYITSGDLSLIHI